MMFPDESALSPGARRDEIHARLFESLVAQLGQMALLFLGQVPHPESGEFTRDPAAAKQYIDQLEMLAAKTRGNLSADESQLLDQSIQHLHALFAAALEAAAS
jgi:hypothetical protein